MFDDLDGPRVHGGNIKGATGLQGDFMTGITEGGEQGETGGLGQGLAAGHTDMMHAVALYPGKDVLEGHDPSAGEGVGGVAITTAQRTAGEPDEHRRPTHAAGLSLQGQEDLGDPQIDGRRGGEF